MDLPKTTGKEDRLSVDDAISLALNHHQNKSFEIAERLYRLVLNVQPSHPVAMANLASICAVTGRLADGIKYMRQAVDMYQHEVMLHCNLGIYLKRDRQYEAACEEFHQTLSLDPSNDLAKYGLAEALKHLGRYGEAALIYSDILKSVSVVNDFDFDGFLDTPFHHRPFPLKYILSTIDGSPFDRAELRHAWEELMRHESPSHSALISFSRYVATLELDSLACALLALMWRSLFENGWYENTIHAVDPLVKPYHLHIIIQNVASLARALNSIGIDINGKESPFFDGGLNYTLASPREWNAFVFQHLILPTIAELKEDVNNAHLIYLLDTASRFGFAQQPHNEEQALFYDVAVREAHQSLGEKLACFLPLEVPLKRVPSTRKPRVAFVYDLIMNESSPVRVLMSFFRGCRNNILGRVVEPVIYGFSRITPEIMQELNELGIKFFAVGTLPKAAPSGVTDPYASHMLNLASHIRKNKIDAVVYVTTDSFLNLAASFRILPVQLFWSMGFTYQHAPNVTAYLYNGTFEQASDSHGKTWRMGRAGLRWSNMEAKVPGNEFRNQNATSQVVLAHLGRIQKINNVDFLNALNDVLKSRPQAGFLYTGNMLLPSIEEYISSSGLSQRCKFVGQVDGQMFVHAIDILLDPWPFGGGHSVCEAMVAGVAVVFYRYDYMKEPGALRSILLAYEGHAGTMEEQEDVRRIFTGTDGRNLLLVANDPHQYADMVRQLIDDPAFRKQVGGAGRAFTEKYLTNLDKMATSYSAHIIEAIEDYWTHQESAAATIY